MRLIAPALAFALFGTLSLANVRAQAQEQQWQEPSGRDLVVAYNTGFRFSIAPGIFIPVNGERVGFSITGDFRYGFDLGPVVLAPGVRLAGYFPSDATILAALATTRLVIPAGPVGPYVLGGLGPGWVSEPDSEVGLAWMAGGGFMWHVSTRFGIGAEATYQAITGTPFKALFVGPSFLIGF
jgi:hypothetical protein